MSDFPLADSMFLRPRHLPPSAWVGHLPFAFWLVERCVPDMLVELGTHAGASYMSFCQAVQDHALSTRCFAVDTWQGDEHAGNYGEEIYSSLKSVHDREYSGFSQLLRMTFDEAQPYFDDGTVDVLHIDGLHTYKAVRHDFETWLPKLSTRGVVLFHDTMVRQRDFGVWRLWAELRERYPAFEFTHSHGLGVLMVGADMPAPLRALSEADPSATTRICRLFESLGNSIVNDSQRGHFERLVVIRDRELSEVRTASEATIGELQTISTDADILRDTISALQAEAVNREAGRLQVVATQEETDEALKNSRRETSALRAHVDEVVSRNQALSDALDAAGQEASALRAQVDEAVSRNHAFSGALEAAGHEASTLRDRLAVLERTLESAIVDARSEQARLREEVETVSAALANAELQAAAGAEHAKHLAVRNEVIQKRAIEEIASLRQSLENSSSELARMYGSRSWRLTRGLRWLSAMLQGKKN